MVREILFTIALVLARIGDGTLFVSRTIGVAVLFVAKTLAVLLHRLRVTAQQVSISTAPAKQLLRQLAQTISVLWPKTKPQRVWIGRAAKKRKKRTKHRQLRLLRRVPAHWRGFGAGIVVSILFIFLPYNTYLFVRSLPNPQILAQQPSPVTTQIFDREGRLLFEIFTDQNRKPVALSAIPDSVKNATIAIEDKNFYQHPGVSVTGIARAVRENTANDTLQGGSTITQQLVKNTLLTSEVTLSRKIREAILAFWTEQIYAKNEILEMYLNQVPYGGTAWGIEAAAQTYFDKRVGELNLAESALLAGLPAAPTRFSPHGAQPELARNRQREVLRRMVEDGYINQVQADEALAVPLEFRPPTNNIKAPHFVMYVKQLLVETYGQRLVEQGGLRVITTLDLDTQEQAETIVSRNIANLQHLRVGNGAALVTNPQSGEILAMVGSRDYFDIAADGNVNVTLAPRQPGSSIKPVNYAAALENGLTAASIVDDAPVAFRIPGQPDYVPVNYDGRFHGKVPLRTALANSYNIPALHVLNQIGVPTMVEMGRRLGITTWENDARFGLSLTLGGGEVRMLDMARGYGAFANNGHRVELNPIISVTDYNGQVFEERTVVKEKVLSEDIAFIISDILADNRARTPAFGPNSLLVIPGKTVSVKTGTTDEKRDNWTIGYTPSFVVAAWVGNNDNTPMHPTLTSGITGASNIWHEIMQLLLANRRDEPVPRPENIIQLPCYGRTEYFIQGTQPSGGCGPLPTPSPTPSPSPQE